LLLGPAAALAQNRPTVRLDLGGGVTLELLEVPHGSFTQGSPPAEKDRKDDERPHQVVISKDYFIGKYPVTRGQFARFVNATGYRTESENGTSGGFGWDGSALVQRPAFNWKNPGFSQTDEHPVVLVTYDDARAFTRWASSVTGRNITLPTEAQWEYAYRGGTTGAYYAADDEKDALALGWFKPNAGNGTHPVGEKKPNALGLFDMGGNAWEWCLDWYAPYPEGPVTDPLATQPDASDKPRRVLRGGSWLKDVHNGRAAARFRSTPGSRNADYGFRVVAVEGASAAQGDSTPPPGDVPSTPPPTAPSASGSSSGGSALVGGLVALGGLGFFGAIVFAIGRALLGARRPGGGISFRPGNDGFWVHAPSSYVGGFATFRYRAQGATQVMNVTLERADNGQFVYTGHAPEGLELLQAAPPAQAQRPPQAQSWGNANQRGWGSTNQPSRGSTNQPSWGSTNQSNAQWDRRGSSWSSSSSSSDDSPPPFRGYPSAY
jgi:formylglycine-generating enzyme required for sulfatase activity